MVEKHKIEIIVLIVLIVLTSSLCLYLVSDSSEEIINNNTSYNNTDDYLVDVVKEVDEVSSDYPHFTNLTITFSMKGINIDHNKKGERMRNAFQIIEDQVGEFNFIEISDYNNANIKVNFPMGNNMNTITWTTPFSDSEGNIEGGEIEVINIYREDCDDYPEMEIHEILHIFGFDDNPKTIMRQYPEGCRPLHSEWSIQYVEHLKFVYSSGERGVEHPGIPYYETISSCEDGWYEPTNSYEWCCPEPNMYVDSDGYCY